METSKPILPIRGRAALLAAACLMAPLHAAEPAATADQELLRRNTAIEEARELLRKGDEAYLQNRFSEATEAYGGARELIPDAPVSAELRQAATERYAQASVEYARELSRKGDLAGAKTAVDKVLSPSVAPNDPGALAFRNQLDDPIRTNPALTKEHAQNVDEVRRLLYTAQGAYDLGKFDEARSTYQKVLRIDPYNSAARRGMEQVAAIVSNYQDAAYDHTRAEMLGMVDAAWEKSIAAPELGPGPADPGGPLTEFGTVTVDALLDQIMVPRILLDQATLDEAIAYLRTVAKRPDPTGAGNDQIVNFNVNLGSADSEVARRIRTQKFNLQLSNVPLRHVLKVLTDMTQTSFTTDDFAVIIAPAGFTTGELVSRTYRVPPDFLTSIGGAAGESGGASDDPFAEDTGNRGLLTERLTAQEALAKKGVTFPEGANATYSAATNTLRVVNTATNQDFISQIVEAMTQTEPVMVKVSVTVIRTEQTHLEELGFDWLVNPFGLSANHMFGSGGTTGNTGGRTGVDFVNPIGGVAVDNIPADPNTLVNPGLVTNGLRSGDQAIGATDNIDTILGTSNRNPSTSVAPGIMALTGLFSDGQVQMVMRGLDQKKGVDLMARPSTVTRSGQQATVEVLREFIYATEYEPPELPNSVGQTSGSQTTPVTPATPTAFEMKEVGIKLEVLPVADANKRFVDVTVNPTFTDFDGYVNYGSPINTTVQSVLGGTQVQTITDNAILMPVFSTQRANTQVTVADGATIAIGGLMSSSIQNVEDKVPVFGDIPIVGRLFSSKATKPVTTALVFLVHVELVDPTGRPYRDR
jgi:general secretion pathway protein D